MDKEQKKKYNREYHLQNKRKNNKRSREYHYDNRERMLGKNFLWRENLKIEVFSHYSGDPPKCACCGESIIEFLTIDHVDGKGAEHRKELGKDEIREGRNLCGTGFYSWLRRNKYPEGFQVLCFNCNCGKGMSDVCPHEKEK